MPPNIVSKQYDLIVFTSPSTFQNFCLFYEVENIKYLKAASIGTTTTKSIQDFGLEPIVTATKSNVEGLSESISEYFKK